MQGRIAQFDPKVSLRFLGRTMCSVTRHMHFLMTDEDINATDCTFYAS